MENQPNPLAYTCGNCFHWERKEEKTPTLGLADPGVCWGAPPSVRPVFQPNTNPPQLVGQQNLRPMTRENERACGSFMPASAGAALFKPGEPLNG